MKIHLFLPFVLIAASTAQAGAVYSNVTNDTGFTVSFPQNSLVEAGDQITLAGGAAYVTDALAALLNTGSSGTALTVTLRLWAVDALNNLGAQLASSTLTNVSFPASTFVPLNFTGLNTVVGPNLVWTLAFTTSDALALELPSYDPPAIGASDNTNAWWNTGSGLQLTTTGFNTENYYFQLNAAPEPGTFLLAIPGALALWALRRRGARAK